MMRCDLAHKALAAIGQAEDGAYTSLDYRIVSSLKEEGLVSAYPTWFYQEMVSNAEELERLRERLKGIEIPVANCKKHLEKLETNLSSWGRTSREIEIEKEKHLTRKPEDAMALRTAGRLEEKIQRLEAMPVPGGYKPTFDGDYVRLTEMGELVKAHLSGRQAELDDIVLEDMIRELEGVQTTIDAQYSRFTGMLDLMLKDGFKKEYTDVIDCAVRLSTIEGPVPEIYGRMKVINNYFFYEGNTFFSTSFNGYNRLIPTFAAARQEGDIEARKEEIIETYRELVKNRYYKNFFTWWLAAEVMNLGRPYPEKNVERYEGVRDALMNKGWENRKRHTDYMAANLARRHASPEELADEHKRLQLKLTERNRLENADSGTAALILMDGEGTLDERADRFVQAYEAMQSYGWDNHINFYPAAAAISLMPGSIEGNVLWLDRIAARLKEGGCADKAETREGHKDGLTYRALPLLLAAYKDQFSQEVMPSIIMHSGNSFFTS